MENIRRKNQLLLALENKEITLQEFLTKCAEWVAEDVETYSFKPIPMVPKEVSDFEKIPENARMNIDSQYYFDHPQILAYYNLRDMIHWENKSQYEWLRECLRYLDGEEQKTKIVRKMAEYPAEKEVKKNES